MNTRSMGHMVIISNFPCTTLSQRINYSTWNSNFNPYSTWNSKLSLVFNLEFQFQWGFWESVWVWDVLGFTFAIHSKHFFLDGTFHLLTNRNRGILNNEPWQKQAEAGWSCNMMGCEMKGSPSCMDLRGTMQQTSVCLPNSTRMTNFDRDSNYTSWSYISCHR